MAFSLRVRILGRRRLQRRLRTAAKTLPVAMEGRLRQASELVVGTAQRQFKGSRTRALYKISGGRRVRRKPPRAITSPPHMLGVFEGTYRQRISYDVRRRGRKRLTSTIGPVGVNYAIVHEFGLRGMPQRPVLTPAIKKTQDEVFRLIGASFRVL